MRHTEIFCEKLEVLKALRNAIVHNGGLLTAGSNESFSMAGPTSTGINGIYSMAGFVYITEDVIKELEEIVDETAGLLCKIQ
jgi:hypothetical protein